MSFRYKFVFSFIIIEAFFVIIIVLFNAYSLKTQSNHLINDKAKTASIMLAEIIKIPLLVNDLATIDDALVNFSSISNVLHVQVKDMQGNILSEVSNNKSVVDDATLREILKKQRENNAVENNFLTFKQRNFLFFEEAIHLEEGSLGYVNTVYDVSESIALIENNTFFSYLLIIIELIISAFVSSILGYRITSALNKLSEVANKIANNQSVVVPTYKIGNDEIGRLYAEMQGMQENILERTQQLTKARHEALLASQGKSDFLAIMSHEIRTPLNGILGSLNLIDIAHLSKQEAKYLRTSKDSSEILLTVINDILDYSKIEAGKFSLNQHMVCVNSIIESINIFYKPLIEKKGLSFKVEKRNINNLYIRGDEIRIKQILNNYLNNALKFTQNGSITLVADRLDNNTLSFSIIDTGIGIHKADIIHLFKDFSQVHTGKNRQFGGTGLGLSISKKLAKLMHGSVHASSKYGKGSCFSFELKPTFVTQAMFDEEHNHISKKEEEIQNDLKANVLLVEDNRTNQMIAAKLLEKVGCQVSIANNGVEAIEILQKKEFDIILMDCQMPIMDGFEASEYIRKSGNLIPIIALTANAQDSDKQACLQVGMNGFLSKPFKPNALYQEILKHIKT